MKAHATLYREETHDEPKFAHIWQGWRWRIKNAFPVEIEWDYADDGCGYVDVPYVAGKKRNFIGWDKLLRPTVSRKRLVDVGKTCPTTVTIDERGMVVTKVQFENLSAGRYSVRVANTDDETVFSGPIDAQISDGDTLHVEPKARLTFGR